MWQAVCVVKALWCTFPASELWLSELRVVVVGPQNAEIPRQPMRAFSPRDKSSATWLRLGTSDVMTWGEINVRGEYLAPWPLPNSLRVLDLGANVGYFGRWAFEQWSVAQLLSVEPDAENFAVLEQNHGELGTPVWKLLKAAASTKDGSAGFLSGRDNSSRLNSEGTDQVRTVDVFPLLAGCDLAKIDIEGGEWPILRDPRFAENAPPLLVIEYHGDAEHADPRSQAVSLLTAAGYSVSDGHRSGDRAGLLWARRDAAPQT